LLTLRRWRVALCLSCSYNSSGMFLIVKVAMGNSPREGCRIEPKWKLTISDHAGQGRDIGLQPAICPDPTLVSMWNTLPCRKRFPEYSLCTTGNKVINKGLSPIMARKVGAKELRSFQEPC
jgi:hypothetical protein